MGEMWHSQECEKPWPTGSEKKESELQTKKEDSFTLETTQEQTGPIKDRWSLGHQTPTAIEPEDPSPTHLTPMRPFSPHEDLVLAGEDPVAQVVLAEEGPVAQAEEAPMA